MNAMVEELKETMDWSKFDPPGGIKHYEGIKHGCIPLLGALLGDLERQKVEDKRKLARWEDIAQKAGRLHEDFHGLTESHEFMEMLKAFDRESLFDLPRPGWMTVTNWIEVGKTITWTLNAGVRQFDPLKARIADAEREFASASALRNLMDGFITVCELEFTLRHAPTRFRTRIFRDMMRELSAITVSAGTLNFKVAPKYLARYEIGVERIMAEVKRMKRIGKLLKREVERHGETFWAGFDAWMAAKGDAA